MNQRVNLKLIYIISFVILLGVLVFIGVRIYNNKVLENTYTINLLGKDNVFIYEGDTYNELGYVANDYNGRDVSYKVEVKNNVNSNVVGKYEVVYSINTFFKNNNVKRYVTVLENPFKDIKFFLNGSNNIELNLNDDYNELGFTCWDKNINCSTYVTTKSNVLMNKVGMYNVEYILKIGSKEKTLVRYVKVNGPSYDYKLNNEKLVNTDVIIEFKSNLNNLDYIITPSGEIVKSEFVTYKVSQNGNYKFIMYDTNGVSTNADISVDNIDKEAPTGSCKALIDGNYTIYSVTANDNKGVTKYVHANYRDKIYTTNSFSVNSRIEDGKVLIYDEASNYTSVVCDTDYSYRGVSGNNSIYQYSSDTLKYWIEKVGTDYHIVHVWMDDPYNQMKTALPNSFGTLDTANNILYNVINKNRYSNKGIVAINGSGFVSAEFDQSFYEKIPEWKNTAVTPIVINNGVVLRNFTNQVLPANQYFTYGLTKNGNLKYYGFETNNINLNQQTSAMIINDGVKYTFGFKPVLVWNSKRVVNNEATKYVRQAIGQIDKNNFVIISTSNTSLNTIANRMLSLGCHTGFNLDGGYSVSLLYKGNDSQINTIKRASRQVADILYFVEN